MNSKRSIGVTIFAIILISDSLLQMIELLYFQHYKNTFQFLSDEIILFRYFVSWTLRITGLISGIGILFLKNTFRKFGLSLFIFTIITIYWKYPSLAFKNDAVYLDQFLKDYGCYPIVIKGYGTLTFSSLANGTAIFARVLGVLYAALFIYYFTRPKVKRQFK